MARVVGDSTIESLRQVPLRLRGGLEGSGWLHLQMLELRVREDRRFDGVVFADCVVECAAELGEESVHVADV